VTRALDRYATNVPVSADLENGFGDAPEVLAEAILLAAKVGRSQRQRSISWLRCRHAVRQWEILRATRSARLQHR
jgi:hypothetical protein